MKHGINIFSGARVPLGAALTNPTAMAVQKGTLQRGYGIVFGGRRFADVETAYQTLKGGTPEDRDDLMVELIAAKFQQHPGLLAEVEEHGGRDFLCACEHFTGAKTEGFRSWEGKGMESRFIRNLVAGYDRAKQGVHTEQGQFGLF